MSSSDQGQAMKPYIKKLYCSEHGSKFAFKCGYEHCTKPFVCAAAGCIDEHFHHQNQGKLVLFKFDCSEYSKKFQQLDRVLNKQDFSTEAKMLKSFIDELKLSMVSIYKDYKEIHSRRESFAVQLSKPFDYGLMSKVEETINIGQNLRKSIDLLKSKVNLNFAQNTIFQSKKDQLNLKPESQVQSSPLAQKNQKIILQSENKKNSEKIFNKQDEPSDFILEKGQNLANDNQVIDLQIPKNTQTDKLNGSIREEKSISQPEIKYIPPYQRPQIKDSFEELFQNGSRMFSSEKVSSLRNFLHSSPQNRPNQQNGKVNGQQNTRHQSLKIYERDFLMKKQLTIFLEQRIKNFSWGLCEQIHSSLMPFRSIQKFHELLEGRRNLLFIFISQDRILGSFYPSRYPRLVQKLRNDPNSFIFISNPSNISQAQILQFKAVPSQFHLSVSERLYICHGNTPSYADGIRTIQKNFNQMNYCLPSVSYKFSSCSDEKNTKKVNQQIEKKGLSGFLKVKDFFVLQVNVGEQQNIYQID